MQCVRIWFHKNGRAKYISHLDLMRSMTRAVKRSRIPLWYTEGFNPHPYMTFPLPLSLGVESDRECMDIKVEDGISLDEIKKSFEGRMPEGLDVFDVTLPFNDAREIKYSGYRITLDFNSHDSAKLYAEKAESAVADGNLVGHKKGKQGRRKIMKEIPLAEHIFHFKAECDDKRVVISVDLSAGNVTNINPSVFLNALNEKIESEAEYYSFYKTALYVDKFEIFN